MKAVCDNDLVICSIHDKAQCIAKAKASPDRMAQSGLKWSKTLIGYT